MRTIVAWAVVAVAALSGLVVVRAELRKAQPGREKLETPATTLPSDSVDRDTSPPRSPTRDLLRYGDAPATPPPPTPASTRTFGGIPVAVDDADAAPQQAPRPRALLLGFIRRSASIQAVLELDGMVEVASAGTTVRDWNVVLIDSAAETARVRSPEGEVFDLTMGVAPAAEGPHVADRDDAPAETVDEETLVDRPQPMTQQAPPGEPDTGPSSDEH